LETLRQFAADRLAEQTDAAEVQDRNGAYWCGRAVTLGRATGGSDQHAVLDAIDVDIDNYRSAFAHLLSTGRVNDAARGVQALDTYFLIRRTREGLRWHQRLLGHTDLDPTRRLGALAEAARAEALVGDVYRAEGYATEAVEFAEAAGVDVPWGAFEALMQVARDRQDPASYRR